MEKFHNSLAQELLNTFKEDIGNICVVLPGRRSKIFFKTALASQSNKPIWAPDIYSIEDWMAELSSLNSCDNIRLLFNFYKIYKDIEGENAQAFDEFMSKAKILLHDFNEIDSYLVNTEKLFASISEARAMEVWNVDGSEPTDFQKKYLEFWKKLSSFYDALKTHLKQQNLAYPGMIFRHCAENIETLYPAKKAEKSWKKIVFAGFNAISASEEKIIRHLIKENEAEIFWDADEYYLNNSVNEAGLFLRRFIGPDTFTKLTGKSGKVNFIGKQLIEGKKNVQIIGVPQKTAQAKVAAEILASMPPEEDYKDVALIPADEQLLLPVLNALPQCIEKANITMGYPLKNSAFAGLIDAILRLHENPVKMNLSKHAFYHKDILNIIHHPRISVLKNRHKELKEIIEKISNKINKENRIFLRSAEIISLFPKEEALESIKQVFYEKTDPRSVVDSLLNFTNHFEQTIEETNPNEQPLEGEVVICYASIIRQVSALMEQYDEIEDLKTLRLLFSGIAGSETLPFYGEPLSGLQIMGMLETRTLDFKTIIMLSANEGVLPAGKSMNSFIPYELKKAFHIPSYTEKDAVFAYHFYRLLQRAENIYLLYNTQTDEMGSGEKTRFITQLLYELPKVNPNVTIEEKILKLPLPINLPEAVTIIKTPKILQRLEEINERGFSPSALNTFINCPLDFYYKYIMRLKEEDEPEETIEAATMGIFIHNVLKTLLKPFEGKILRPDDVEKMIPLVEELTKAEFKTKFNESDISSGKNLLIFVISVNYIKSFLKKEKQHLEQLLKENKFLTVQQLEEEMIADIELPILGAIKKIRLKGTADRIDKIGNTTRLIDYKTGTVFPEDLKLAEIAEITKIGKSKSLQLFLYALMYKIQFPEDKNPLISGIISFKRLSSGLMNLTINNLPEITDEAEIMKTHITAVIENLFDPEISFEHSSEAAFCAFCNG
jgi:ATP-dependent helicase/nuclease subunit B